MSLNLRSFDIGLYVAFITVVVSTLYATRSIFERVKKIRRSNNQVAPIPTVSGSIRRHSQQSGRAPQIQLNNNQYNPEILDSKYVYVYVAFLISFAVIALVLIFHGNSIDDEIFQVISRLYRLGIVQAIFSTLVLMYPYVTNERLRRFITDEYFN